MSNDAHERATSSSASSASGGQARRPRRRLQLALLGALILLAAFVIPPLVNLGRYKTRITQLMSASLGRPVRLSSVELRLLPWPGFVLTDVSVAEDPAYGAEPVLHANTVTANIRMVSLWRGRLAISSISVDEASLNVVRAGPGQWNLDPLFHTAAAHPGSPLRATSLPYLEATNSRIDFKNGAEKLPFSLMNTDLSFWQESPNEWRIRLRGQPARTDVSLDLADTGIVRLEASLGRAPALHLMPLHADLDWSEAQLGQLSRLLLGSDEGWRGNLAGELHLDGTPAASRVTARLQASNVHRAEFVPLSPFDFDASCSLTYHYRPRALDDLVCNSPLSTGRLRVTGELPAGETAPNLTAELDRIPVGAALELLRTMRSGIDPSLEAAGTISGRLVYEGGEGQPRQGPANAHDANKRALANRHEALNGALSLEGFALSGGSLSSPLQAPKFVLRPPSALPRTGQEQVMVAGTMSLQAGGAVPLDANLRLTLNGYQADIRGQASITRAREIEETAGMTGATGWDHLTGPAMTVNLQAGGPWLPPEDISSSEPVPRPAGPDSDGNLQRTDSVSGTITIHDASWREDFLAGHVHIAQAILHVGGGELRWDPVDFSYGPVKGRGSLTLPQNCLSEPDTKEAAAACIPQFQIQIGSLNAATMQAAFLGARRKGTLLSDLLSRLHPTVPPPWPEMEGAVEADAFEVGPVTLRQASATVKIAGNSAEFSSLEASLLGGRVKAHGAIRWADGDQPLPSYSITAEGQGIKPAAVGLLLGARWTGGPIAASGTVDLSGFTPQDLAASATGTLHFDWGKGTIAGVGSRRDVDANPAQTTMTHFSRWSGEARIADNALTLGPNQMLAAGGKTQVRGEVQFGTPPEVEWNTVKSK
jgi:hypothetical protein